MGTVRGFKNGPAEFGTGATAGDDCLIVEGKDLRTLDDVTNAVLLCVCSCVGVCALRPVAAGGRRVCDST